MTSESGTDETRRAQKWQVWKPTREDPNAKIEVFQRQLEMVEMDLVQGAEEKESNWPVWCQQVHKCSGVFGDEKAMGCVCEYQRIHG